MKGRTFIITGPSGVGKGTIIQELFARQPHLYFSVSATTRGEGRCALPLYLPGTI